MAGTAQPDTGETQHQTPPNRSARRGGGQVTLDDVAQRVGVSARTVSRVVNDQGGCRPETRQRILDAIDELGYRPNLLARGLSRLRSDTIGLVTTTMVDPFFPEVAESIQRATERLGRTLIVTSTNLSADHQRRTLANLRGLGVDGVIVFPVADTLHDLQADAADGLPIVVLNEYFEDTGLAGVHFDIQAGARGAVEHLIARGRRRIAMAVDDDAYHAERGSRRYAGYVAALTAAGMEVDERLVVTCSNDLDGGRGAARRLMSASGERPDAVFAYNDLIAFGVMQQLTADGLAIPDDVAVVGFDDIAMCEVVRPALTTVRLDRDLLGARAVETLYALVDENEPVVAPKPLPCPLVVRNST